MGAPYIMEIQWPTVRYQARLLLAPVGPPTLAEMIGSYRSPHILIALTSYNINHTYDTRSGPVMCIVFDIYQLGYYMEMAYGRQSKPRPCRISLRDSI